jgi:hypothetical protein
MWLFEELGIAYERIDIGGPFGKNREAQYLTLQMAWFQRSMTTVLFCGNPT